MERLNVGRRAKQEDERFKAVKGGTHISQLWFNTRHQGSPNTDDGQMVGM